MPGQGLGGEDTWSAQDDAPHALLTRALAAGVVAATPRTIASANGRGPHRGRRRTARRVPGRIAESQMLAGLSAVRRRRAAGATSPSKRPGEDEDVAGACGWPGAQPLRRPRPVQRAGPRPSLAGLVRRAPYAPRRSPYAAPAPAPRGGVVSRTKRTRPGQLTEMVDPLRSRASRAVGATIANI